MKNRSVFDQRPIVVAVAGSNGAGKTTFHRVHLRPAGLHFVNAGELARELSLEPYAAARVADALRRELIGRRESFVFETVFSDPVGSKLAFLKEAAAAGYTVVLCFIWNPDVETSEERVSIRVSQGGHDAPSEKLQTRFPRTLANLAGAIRELPHVLVYDNSELATPFRCTAAFEDERRTDTGRPGPEWLDTLLE